MALIDTDTVNASTFIPTLWSRLTADAREENLVMANTFDRRYEAEAGKQPYNTINIQSVPNLTVGATLGVGGTLTHTEASMNARVVLSIDTHAYRSFDLEVELEQLSNVDLMAKLTHKAGYAVSLRIDDDAAGMVDDFATNLVGTLAVPLTYDDVVQGWRLLEEALAPQGNRWFVMHPTQAGEFYKEERFINQLYGKTIGGMDGKSLRDSVAVNIFGLKWVSSGNVEGTNAAGHDNGIYHSEAVALAIVDNMRMEKQYELDTDSTKVAVHALYGMIEVRDDHGVYMRGS